MPKPSTQHPAFRLRHSGFTLVETLVALFLIGLGLLAIAPMFVYSGRVSAISADLGSLGARAVQRLELLRETKFAALPAGGSLTANVSGYFDASDPDATLRWTIVDDASPATRKTITLRAIATRSTGMGPQKSLQLMTLKAK